MRIPSAARTVAVVAVALTMMTAGSAASAPASGKPAGGTDEGPWPTDFHAWSTKSDFQRGTSAGVRLTNSGGGAITLPDGVSEGGWTSPWYSPPAGFTDLVPSWQVNTPSGSWVEIGLQVRTATTESQWYEMGRWAFDDSTIERSSVDSQLDEIGRIWTDTFVASSSAPGGRPTSFRLSATLHATPDARPVIRQVAATSSVPAALPATSEPWTTNRTELAVPAYSQSTHSGEYPRYGGGGGVWCSPTSTAMVLSYFGTGPTQSDIDALPPDKVFDRNGRTDGIVDFAAIHTWDHVYEGAGNWPFNTAYASEYGLDGSIRQYSSLRPVERWIARGVPVIVSIRWNNNDGNPLTDLDGSSITQTNGHIMVVTGFTASGDVLVNDPASPSNDAVPHTYRRDQFERNWLRASDGTTYVIKPNHIRG